MNVWRLSSFNTLKSPGGKNLLACQLKHTGKNVNNGLKGHHRAKIRTMRTDKKVILCLLSGVRSLGAF